MSPAPIAIPLTISSLFGFVATTFGSIWPFYVLLIGAMLVFAFFEAFSDNSSK